MTLSREQMLAEMGITPLWVLRDSPQGEVAAAAELLPEFAAEVESSAQTLPTEARMPQRRQDSGEQLPHPEAVARVAGMPVAGPPHVEPVPSIPPATPADVSGLDWDGVIQGVQACRACDLCKQRKQAVPGVGDRSPDWLFIGEGPGAEEDARGEPFVGQAGKLLDNMLAALDISRDKGVYIANAVKCRPPGNRTPEAGEMAACRPWLLRQIELLKPRIIVLLGKAAVHSLLHEDKPLSGMRGRRHEFAGIPVVVTYHPAYLLRNLPEKAKAWEDLVLARKILREARG